MDSEREYSSLSASRWRRHMGRAVTDRYMSIGGFYAFILSQNPDVSLSVVARSNYEAVKNEVGVEDLHHTMKRAE